MRRNHDFYEAIKVVQHRCVIELVSEPRLEINRAEPAIGGVFRSFLGQGETPQFVKITFPQ